MSNETEGYLDIFVRDDDVRVEVTRCNSLTNRDNELLRGPYIDQEMLKYQLTHLPEETVSDMLQLSELMSTEPIWIHDWEEDGTPIETHKKHHPLPEESIAWWANVECQGGDPITDLLCSDVDHMINETLKQQRRVPVNVGAKDSGDLESWGHLYNSDPIGGQVRFEYRWDKTSSAELGICMHKSGHNRVMALDNYICQIPYVEAPDELTRIYRTMITTAQAIES